MHLLEEQRMPIEGAEILVVGGGKGGVGKTCLAVNLAVEVARRGWRTVLLDADLSCSNVETVLGVRCETQLDDFFRQRGAKSLEPIVCDTRYANLRLIPGASGLLDVANPGYKQKVALVRELRRLSADLVIVDLDAGAHLNTLDFFLMATDSGVLVITPERTSIDNAFKFLRAALFRRIGRFYKSDEVGQLLKQCMTLSEFMARLRSAETLDASIREQVVAEIAALASAMRPRIVVNKAGNAYEAKIAANILSKHARVQLMVEPEFLGHLYFDQYVSEAVNSGVPFIVGKPKRKISTCIADMANRLGYF